MMIILYNISVTDVDCGDPDCVENSYVVLPDNTTKGNIVTYMCDVGKQCFRFIKLLATNSIDCFLSQKNYQSKIFCLFFITVFYFFFQIGNTANWQMIEHALLCTTPNAFYTHKIDKIDFNF